MGTYPTWSEGSVFVIVGMTTPNDDLLRKGLSMILNEGHPMEPALVNLIYKKLVEGNIIEDPGHRDMQYLIEMIPEWIAELEKDLQDERAQAIEDLLASLPVSDFN
jgi:hypothetical protein|tara:strand:+ start:580 stop:897 length:318 start_codon:yes stop_codon:yes gene_type:complete